MGILNAISAGVQVASPFLGPYAAIAAPAMNLMLKGIRVFTKHKAGDHRGALQELQEMREGANNVLPPKVAGAMNIALDAVTTLESYGLSTSCLLYTSDAADE